MSKTWWWGGGWQAALLLAACQATPPATPIPPANAACVVHDDSARAALTIGVLDTIEAASAPIPRNAAERLAFRQLYETLTTVDCAGHAGPRLADSWTSSTDQRVWQFRIRPGAQFWDGSAVTARDVAASWAGSTVLPIADITVLAERELRVTFTSPVGGAARFADPALAIARHNGGWPLGTGVYRVGHHDAQTLRLIATRRAWSAADTLVFRSFAAGDARAALDAGVYVLVAADPAAIAYARVLPAYTATPVSWSRTYVLATPHAPTDAVVPLAEADVAAIRESLRAETRAVTEWKNGCSMATSSAAATTTHQRRILYPSSDAVARGIAERLVALAWPPARAPQWLVRELGANYASAGAPVAIGVNEKGLSDAFRSGSALGVVASVTDIDACSHRLRPLLQARVYLMQRGSLGRVVVDGDGVLRFTARTP